jgi:hypothetical protein
MKKTLKIISIILLSLCFAFMVTTIILSATMPNFALAEEITEELPSEDLPEEFPPTEILEETPTENEETLNSLVTELLAILKEQGIESAGQYFEQKILPWLISSIVSLVLGVIMLLPTIKDKIKYKALKEKYNVTCDERDGYKNQVGVLSKDTVKAIVLEVFGETLKESILPQLEKFKIENNVVSDVKTELDTISAKIDAFIKGATNAWSTVPEAVSALTEAPEKIVLQQLENRKLSLENYIREIKGEEAEKIIAELEA